MKTAIVNVSTGKHYVKGQSRLLEAAWRHSPDSRTVTFTNTMPAGCPSHDQVPYAMKPYALRAAAERGADLLLWCDASILPIKSLGPLWARIERDGYWFANNGWSNYEWTADGAYPDLFPTESRVRYGVGEAASLEYARDVNRKIPHVVATAFGLSMKSEIGRQFLAEYFRLASETKAFCGPWINSLHADSPTRVPYNKRIAPCGPPDVRGHRHDQSCASVIAWRLGMKLSSPPDVFAYGKSADAHDERTILLADGAY